MSTAADVVIIGDCNPDIVLSDPQLSVRFAQQETLVESGVLTIGGSGSITSCACARLGLQTMLIGAVGNDALGNFMAQDLAKRGVDATACAVLEGQSTGFSVILSQPHDRAIVTYPGTIGRLSYHHLPLDELTSARHVHLTAYFLLSELRPHLPRLVERLKAAEVTVSIDTNWDPSGVWDGGLDGLLGSVDLFMPNAAEACAISHNSDARTAAAVLSKRGTTVVVKQGAQGALLGRNGDVIAHEGYPVQPLDTTGAGDAFNAGFLKGWLSGASPEECLRLGNAVGALSTQGLGAVDSQPDITAVSGFLKERS